MFIRYASGTIAAALLACAAGMAHAQDSPGTRGQASAIETAPAPSDERSNQAVGTSGAADTTAAAEEPLPSTASPLAMSGLIGLLSLGGAFALRRIRR
jgi:hypothetical protein